jgi:hypothetical protein
MIARWQSLGSWLPDGAVGAVTVAPLKQRIRLEYAKANLFQLKSYYPVLPSSDG